MAPRIVESDYEDEDEVDELASDSSASPPAVAPPSKPSAAASTSALASGRASARIRTTGPTAPSSSSASHPKARPGRQAAQKANETMEVDSPLEDDDDEEAEEDELEQFAQLGDEDDEEEEEEGEDEDAAGETFLQDDEEDLDREDDDDDVDASPAPAAPVKIKLKLGNGKGPSSVMSASSPAPSKKATAKASKASKKGKGKAVSTKAASKRKREEYEDPSLMDMDGEDEGEDVPIPDEDDEELDFLSDDSNKSDVSFSKMTARQRAAHVGDEAALMELPSAPSKKKVLTADEVAMRKVETSRRRKHLLNKKLEEEKAETIERLLKKPMGRKGGASTSRLAAQTKVEKAAPSIPLNLPAGAALDENGNPLSEEALIQQQAGLVVQLPTMFRWVSSIKDGKYTSTWAVPNNLEDRFSWPPPPSDAQPRAMSETGNTPAEPLYPPPRPPPKTRMLRA